MSLNLEDKKAVVAEVAAQVAEAQTIVVAEYRGIGVASMTQLRAKAREQGVYLRVLKNTLARRAVAGTPFEGLAEQMVGPLVYGISADPVAAAKVISDFAKVDQKIVVKAGSYDGKVLDAAGVPSWLLSQAAKNCCPNCCSLCKLQWLALRALWLLWPRKSRAKKPLLNIDISLLAMC